MIEWQWWVARLFAWMQFYSSTVAKLFYSREKTKLQNATEQRNIIAASLRKGKTWIIRSVRKPTPPFYCQRAEMVRRESMTQQNISKRIWKQNVVLTEIQSAWKWYNIRQQAYNNVIVHILCSMCCVQVHMVTQHWENIRHHVVHVEKWEHLPF